MNIGSVIKSRRKELNLTLKFIAEKVGVSEGTVSRWESGDIANMRRDKIAKLSDVLQLPPSVIAGLETPTVEIKAKNGDVESLVVNYNDYLILKKIKKLNKDDKAYLETFLDAITDKKG